MGLINNYNDHNNDVTFSLYSVILCIPFLILYTHTDYYLHVITSYVYCTVLLTIVAHIFFSLKCEVKSHFLCIPYIRTFLRTGQLRIFRNFFYESVIEAHCQEWRPQ